MNGGTCTENGGGYDCSCVTQYSGPNCESKSYELFVFSFFKALDLFKAFCCKTERFKAKNYQKIF